MRVGKKKKNESEKKSQIVEESAMKLHDSTPIILFDEKKKEMSLPLLGADDKDLETTSHPLHNALKQLADGLRNGEVPPIHDVKVFLKKSAMQFHYLAAHLSLVYHDKKCTRNQVKRAYTLTNAQNSRASRKFIRLMLEVLRSGTFTDSVTEVDQKAEMKQISAIYTYVSTIALHENNVTVHNVMPFAALCAVFAYCTVNDEVIRKFSSQNPVVESEHDAQRVIGRRITFLEFMMGQLLQTHTPGSYTWAILAVAVYLYQLMGQSDSYDKQKQEKMKTFLKKWLPKQWAFINREFADCPPMKRALARVIKGFEEVDCGDMERLLRKNCEEEDFEILNERMGKIKKDVADYQDYLFVVKAKK